MCYCIQSRITKLVLRHSVQSKGLVCTLSLNKYVKTMSLHWLHQTQKSLPTGSIKLKKVFPHRKNLTRYSRRSTWTIKQVTYSYLTLSFIKLEQRERHLRYIDVSVFSDDTTRDIFSKNTFTKCFPYLLLTDANSAAFSI